MASILYDNLEYHFDMNTCPDDHVVKVFVLWPIRFPVISIITEARATRWRCNIVCCVPGALCRDTSPNPDAGKDTWQFKKKFNLLIWQYASKMHFAFFKNISTIYAKYCMTYLFSLRKKWSAICRTNLCTEF